MAKEVMDMKQFLEKTRSKSTKYVAIKEDKARNCGKFKVRCGRYIYTLKVNNLQKMDRIRHSLPPGVTVKKIGKGASK